jgi:hypothetical protein
MITGITLCLMFALPQQGGPDLLAYKNADAARAITAEFGIDDWSGRLVERSLDSATSADGRSELLLANCDVLRMVAGRKLDELERLTALGEAGEAYVDYLEDDPSSSRLAKAQANLGTLAFIYGQTLAQLILNGAIDDDNLAEKTEQAEKIFETALAGMKTLIKWWEGLLDDDPEKASSEYTLYLPSVYNSALINRYWAELYDDDLMRLEKANIAIDILSEFVLGAPFLPQQRGYSALADCFSVKKEYEDAADYYRYVIDRVTDLIDQEGNSLGLSYIVQLQDAGQESMLGLSSMYLRKADFPNFWITYRDFEAWIVKNDATVSRMGYTLRLSAARQMIADGDFRGAIDLASAVAVANERNVLRLQANSVMGRAISLAPDYTDISLDILYSSAEGAYFQKRYADAVEGFRLLVPRLNTSSPEIGAKAYYYLGLSWTKQHEALLAMVSHQIGYQSYPDDEDFALKNASKWQKAAERLSNNNPEDEILREFSNEATVAVQVLGGGGDNLEWNQAKQLLKLAKSAARAANGTESGSTESRKAAAAYQRAIESLGEITSDNGYYELALVAIGIAEYDASEYDATASARSTAILSDYVNNYITDEANDPKDPLQRKVRKDKEPEAVFYLGLAQRRDNNSLGVLSSFENFLARYPSQPSLAFATMTYRIEAYILLNDIDGAIAEYEAMHEIEASDARISIGSYYIYRHYNKLSSAANIVDPQSPILRHEAKYLHDFNSYSSAPRWQNLIGEADLLSRVGNNADAGKMYALILDKHASASDFTDAFRFKAEIGYVDAMLEQGQIGRAVEIIDTLLESRPKNLRVKTAAVKVKAGFLLYDSSKARLRDQIRVIPGEDTPEALATASDISKSIIKIAEFQANDFVAADPDNSGNKYYYPEWWEAQVTQAFVLYQRHRTNPADMGKHITFVKALSLQAPNLGKEVAGAHVAASLKWILDQK